MVTHSFGTTGTPRVIVLTQSTLAVLAYRKNPATATNGKVSPYSSPSLVSTPPAPSCSLRGRHAVQVARQRQSRRRSARQRAGVLVHAVGPARALTLACLRREPRPAREHLLRRRPAAAAAGNLIAARTQLHGSLPPSRPGMLPGFRPSPEDYRYSPRLGRTFRHFADDMHELVIERRPERTPFQGVFYSFPGLQSFSMRDLYAPYPSKPD